MPLARLENFLKNLNGNTLYVDPNELDATDSIENRGNSRLRPFKTIQRALLEAARFAYVAGSNNDLFDQTTILISPGTHYIDNRPGYYVDASNIIKDINNATKSIAEFNILSNFDLTDPNNELFTFNSSSGGVIIPKGTSLIATDLRKTKIRPLFVPDPNQSEIASSAIFKLTGACYLFGFTIFDGDPSGKVYNTYSTNTISPFYSHHKLTAFEYADGVNKINNSGHTDLEMYYYKVAGGFGQQSGRNVIDGYSNLQPNIDEYRIVGELGSGSIGITSIRSGNGSAGSNTITVDTETEHGLSPQTPILISGVGDAEGSPTITEYNGSFTVSTVLSPTSFTYLTVQTPSGVKLPTITGNPSVKVISDTVTSASPYVFNCSLKSVYGLNGLHADGSKATGFRSIVTAQFTGISLQKDDRAFVRYNEENGNYLTQEEISQGKEFLHQNINSIYKPDWASFHIKASNDAFIQCVSIFAIGYANQFIANDGGDQSITNSNSNFGQRSLYSEGFKQSAFAKDDYGFATHTILPKDVSAQEVNIDTYAADSLLPNSNSRVYLLGYDDILNPPSSKFRGYCIGAKENDKIYYSTDTGVYFADIVPNYKITKIITAIDSSTDILTLESVTGISTGLSVKVISKDSIFPDGIDHDQTYFVRVNSGNDVKLYKNLTNCNLNINPVDIKNSVGLSIGNFSLVSRISEIPSGEIGSPIQWDDDKKNWYISINASDINDSDSDTFVSNLSSNPVLFLKRVLDSRFENDRIYRLRYVVPKESSDAAVPSVGFVLQKSSKALNSSYANNSEYFLTPSDDQLSSIRNKNVIVDAYYTSAISSYRTIVTKNPHNLRVGNKISIYNLKSSNEPNPVGLGSGTGYNGSFEVLSVVDDVTFTYLSSIDPGTITVGVSTVASWYSDVISGYKAPPYTIYDTNRSNLPYFTCDKIENHYQIYDVQEVQKYVQGSSDGIYHITLDCFKNTPNRSPFNTSDIKFGQSLDNIYPLLDIDNLVVDPDPSKTAASRKTIGKVDINDPYLSSTKEIFVEYSKDFNIGKRITQFTKSGSNVIITTEQNHKLGGVRNVSSVSPGSGYIDGDYYDIPLVYGGAGSNATINVTISGGIPVHFEIANQGSGYSIGDVLTIRGIPGSTNPTTVSVTLLNYDPNDSDLIQIFGASNSTNNGTFIISSVTPNTITFANSSGVTETSSNAVVILSGVGYAISSQTPTPSGAGTTVNTTYPHSFSVANKVIFENSSTVFTVTNVSGTSTFTVNGPISSSQRVFNVGIIPTLKDTNSTNENLSTRNFAAYGLFKSRASEAILSTDNFLQVVDNFGLNKGDYVQVENEIMLVTRISGGLAFVKRGIFGTQAVSHPTNCSIKTIIITPVELRRPSILRASGHTFEYVGFGPGNYSTSMPSNQTKVLSDDEVSITQSLSNRGGSVFYTGMNNDGEFFIGKQKWNSSTGNVISGEGEAALGRTPTLNLDEITVNKIVVNNEINSSTATQTVKSLTANGESTFKSGITITGITTSTTFVGKGVIPVGGIIMWSGTIAELNTNSALSNWRLCDGSNGTPDLRNRFIVGAHSGDGDGSTPTSGPGFSTTGVLNANYTPGNRGGSTSVGLTIAEMPAHTHSRGVIYPGGGFDTEQEQSGGPDGNRTKFNQETGARGENHHHENRPPYYALAFIMRVA